MNNQPNEFPFKITDPKKRDCVLRALNNATMAKKLILSGAEKQEVLRNLNNCLSWA